MPGILPMKVIKVGTSAQSRIAQACDRCRSKKIRCDGVTPCCTQCANVGFDCKTSDKLSRRAFPRGYTESLEERVRHLEAEVKDLKTLLDEKDEKLDVLSKIRPNAPFPHRPSSALSPASTCTDLDASPTSSTGDRSNGQTLALKPLGSQRQDAHPSGASSGRPFIDQVKARIHESGKPDLNIKTESFFRGQGTDVRDQRHAAAPGDFYVPPRIISDQMINIFLQEWAPLFPLLHRPTFLDAYGDFVSDPADIEDQHTLGQLYLVFGIAALSNEWSRQDAYLFEPVWRSALGSVKDHTSLATLQCYLLATLHSVVVSDPKALQYHKGAAVTLAHQLGLGRVQFHSAGDSLTNELLRRGSWTLYTLDCFSAAQFGLPKQLKEGDIHIEYSADIDDESVPEDGSQAAGSGDDTGLSGALALLRAARVLSRVLDQIYPKQATTESSPKILNGLSDELDAWSNSLPTHLQMHFARGQPSTDVIGDRSPFLSLVYHYIRTLIFRPVAGADGGHPNSSSAVALAQSSKHIVQIVQLLDERRMSFSICMNKDELLLFAGFGLLYQTIGLDQKGKLIQENQRLLCSIVSMLERMSAIGAVEFKKIACAMISIGRFSVRSRPRAEQHPTRRKSDGTMPAPDQIIKATRRTSTVGNNSSRQMFQNGHVPIAPSRRMGPYATGGESPGTPNLSPNVYDPRPKGLLPKRGISMAGTGQMQALEPPNLDYLDFNTESKSGLSNVALERDQMPKRITFKAPHEFDGSAYAPSFIDGAFSSSEVLAPQISSTASGQFDWTSDLWTMSPDVYVPPASTQSAQSLSEDDPVSGEDLVVCDLKAAFPGMDMGKDERMVMLDRVRTGLES